MLMKKFWETPVYSVSRSPQLARFIKWQQLFSGSVAAKRPAKAKAGAI